MKKLYVTAAIFFSVSLFGCSKRFGPLYRDAKVLYAEQKWVETIDKIKLALPFWNESDGQEEKAQAYQLLGNAYHKLKKIDKAIEAYTMAISLSTNTYDAAYSLGVIYLAANQPAPAIRSFKDALIRKKDDPLALVGLGNAFYADENYQEARDAYQRVIESSPGVRDSLDYLKLIDEKMRVPKHTLTMPKRRTRGGIKKH